MENFALFCVLYQNKYGKNFVLVVVKAGKHDWKKNARWVQLHVWNNGKYPQWHKINITYFVFGSLSPCVGLKNWKWYFTIGSNISLLFSTYRLRICIKALLRSVKSLTGQKWEMWLIISQWFWRTKDHNQQGIFLGLIWGDKGYLYHYKKLWQNILTEQ